MVLTLPLKISALYRSHTDILGVLWILSKIIVSGIHSAKEKVVSGSQTRILSVALGRLRSHLNTGSWVGERDCVVSQRPMKSGHWWRPELSNGHCRYENQNFWYEKNHKCKVGDRFRDMSSFYSLFLMGSGPWYLFSVEAWL